MSKIGSIGFGGVAGVGGISIDVQTGDIELLLVAVQLRRAELVEGDLRQMIGAVQNRNDALAKINTVKADLTTQKAYFNGKTTGTELIDQEHYDPSKWSKKQLQDAYAADPDSALARAKNGEFGPQGKELANLAQGLRDAGVSDDTVFKVASGKINAAELDAAIATITAKGDSLSASQQTDMIKLQALQQRRAESYDVATNNIKKTGDNRSGIVSNMR